MVFQASLRAQSRSPKFWSVNPHAKYFLYHTGRSQKFWLVDQNQIHMQNIFRIY